MTVRTRKTITDLIQQLKAQEKEIKAQLSDSQRRLNETRDRIATCYWIIEEVDDIGTDEVVNEIWEHDLGERIPAESRTLTKDEWEKFIALYPGFSSTELTDILASQNLLPPDPYPGCTCPDCSLEREETKPKYNAKPLPLPKKEVKSPVVKKPVKKITKKGKK